ncbi:MAG: hypothetical protein JRI25_21785 [Deltaproteobacteria bacterium]|nr:hypothetical protein [Deltaproteobacteria bacterium]
MVGRSGDENGATNGMAVNVFDVSDVTDPKLAQQYVLVDDGWIYTKDADSFRMARRLIREEGLLMGGSSGAAVWALLEVLEKETGVRRALTILPDSIRNYLTKFVNDEWMREHGFLEEG